MNDTDNKVQNEEVQKEQEVRQARNIFTKEEMIQQIKDCGESIIQHAEEILGDEKYFLNLKVKFEISRDMSQLPSISVKRNFIPESQIERIVNKTEENKEENKNEEKM